MTALTIDVATVNLDGLGGESEGRDEYPVQVAPKRVLRPRGSALKGQ